MFQVISVAALRRQEQQAQEARRREEQAGQLPQAKDAHFGEQPSRKEKQGILKFARYLHER